MDTVKLCCCGCEVPCTVKPSILAQSFVIIIFFAFSYLVGLIIHSVSEVVWRGLRNDEDALKYTCQKLIYKSGGYHNLIHLVEHPKADMTSCELFYMSVQVYFKQILLLLISWCRPFKKYSEIELKYYEAYYWLASHGHISTTSVIESQINFLRNMFIPVILLWYTFPDAEHVTCFAVVLLLSMFVAMVTRQNKVYELIWEDYQMYKDNKENE